MILNSLKTFEEGSDADISSILFEIYKDKFRCTSVKDNIWYQFEEHRWVKMDSDGPIRLLIADTLSREFGELISYYGKELKNAQNVDYDVYTKKLIQVSKTVNKLKNNKGISGIITLAACRFAIDSRGFEDKIDSNRNLIGFDNGVYDLLTGTFREGNPDDNITLSVKYDYEEYGEKDEDGNYMFNHKYIAEIDQFFSEVQPNAEEREFLLIVLASMLDGHVKMEKIFMWIGVGGNGKTKVIELMEKVMGGYKGELSISEITKGRGKAGEASPQIAGLRGKRLVPLNEPENTDTIQMGYFKELSGGDVITTRQLYGIMFSFKPQFKFIMQANERLKINDRSDGAWRRVCQQYWPSRFRDKPNPKKDNEYKRDNNLIEKLEKWKRVFMWYLLKRYYPIYKNNGYKIDEPESIKKLTEEYRYECDIYAEFFDQNYEFTFEETDKIEIKLIFKAFTTWYRELYGIGHGESVDKLRRYLVEKDVSFDKRKIICIGIRNKDINSDAIDNDFGEFVDE